MPLLEHSLRALNTLSETLLEVPISQSPSHVLIDGCTNYVRNRDIIHSSYGLKLLCLLS